MFKRVFLAGIFTVAVIVTEAQLYNSHNIQLVGHISPNSTDFGVDNRRYSGCWAWYQQNKNKEYAISGTSNGTYFIDISSPASPSVSAFVQATQGCTYRELKTYQNYCYIISDDGQPNGFQIVDMQNLPSGVSLIYQGSNYFDRAHTIYIEEDLMFLGSVTFSLGSSSMAVYSLATPTAPVLLRRLEQDMPFIGTVHDMYARHDTIFASCANQGLFMLKFNRSDSTFSPIGSYVGYPKAGYNHSSSVTRNGKFLMFCDEIPAGSPIHLVDIENPGNIQPVFDFIPNAGTTPHNPYIVENEFAVVSCYEDGIFIYDISNPYQPGFVGYFDTYPQGGANNGVYGSINYRGNWGAYPYLPSKLIVANDMQNGVFILDATQAYTTTTKNPVGLVTELGVKNKLFMYPNPAVEKVNFRYDGKGEVDIVIQDIYGIKVFQKKWNGPFKEELPLKNFNSENYLVRFRTGDSSFTRKLIISH